MNARNEEPYRNMSPQRSQLFTSSILLQCKQTAAMECRVWSSDWLTVISLLIATSCYVDVTANVVLWLFRISVCLILKHSIKKL